MQNNNQGYQNKHQPISFDQFSQSTKRPWHSRFEQINSSSTQDEENQSSIINCAQQEYKWLSMHFPDFSSSQIQSLLQENNQSVEKTYDKLSQKKFELHKQNLTDKINRQSVQIRDTLGQSADNLQGANNLSKSQMNIQQQQTNRKRKRADFDRSLHHAPEQKPVAQIQQQQIQQQSNAQKVQLAHPTSKKSKDDSIQQDNGQNQQIQHQQTQQKEPAAPVGKYDIFCQKLVKDLQQQGSVEQARELILRTLVSFRKVVENKELPAETQKIKKENDLLKKGIFIQNKKLITCQEKASKIEEVQRELELIQQENAWLSKQNGMLLSKNIQSMEQDSSRYLNADFNDYNGGSGGGGIC